MNLELIEKPSATGALVARGATYAVVFMSLCIAWSVVDVGLFDRFDPKFGRGGSLAALVFIYGAALIGAVAILLLFQHRATMARTVVHAISSAFLVLLFWRIGATHAFFEKVVDGIGAGESLVLLPGLIGVVASGVVTVLVVLLRNALGPRAA